MARHQELSRKDISQEGPECSVKSYDVLQLEEDLKCSLSAHMFGDGHGCVVIHEGHCFFHGHWAYVRSSQWNIL